MTPAPLYSRSPFNFDAQCHNNMQLLKQIQATFTPVPTSTNTSCRPTTTTAPSPITFSSSRPPMTFAPLPSLLPYSAEAFMPSDNVPQAVTAAADHSSELLEEKCEAADARLRELTQRLLQISTTVSSTFSAIPDLHLAHLPSIMDSLFKNSAPPSTHKRPAEEPTIPASSKNPKRPTSPRTCMLDAAAILQDLGKHAR
jgi:hypothetical protein